MTKDSNFPYPDGKGRWTFQGKVHRCLPKAFARRFLKTKIIVSVTYFDDEFNEVETRQLWGIIAAINARQGIVVMNPNRNIKFYLPPDLSCLEPAKRREYRLKPTGEILMDPGYITSWTVAMPPDENWENWVYKKGLHRTWRKPALCRSKKINNKRET
jgi:hypothetical protein